MMDERSLWLLSSVLLCSAGQPLMTLLSLHRHWPVNFVRGLNANSTPNLIAQRTWTFTLQRSIVKNLATVQDKMVVHIGELHWTVIIVIIIWSFFQKDKKSKNRKDFCAHKIQSELKSRLIAAGLSRDPSFCEVTPAFASLWLAERKGFLEKTSASPYSTVCLCRGVNLRSQTQHTKRR